MKRRDFFKKGVVAAATIPVLGSVSAKTKEQIDRSNDNWFQVATGKSGIPEREKSENYDVVVIGGGMAGISAAVSAARNGAKTVLIQDRSVLGGNASSEIRVTVNGVQSLKNKHRVERETGIIEEILIENWVYNKQESYPVWDHVLFDFVKREPNLDLMLNTQALEPEMSANEIKAIKCWQSSTEMSYTIQGDQFIDCSGDGIVAASAGAEYRTGRESREEFGESYAPEKADGWVMGECIMMITKDTGHPMPFKAPSYAIPFEAEKAFEDKHRRIKQLKEGFWWVELSDDFDVISTREDMRDKLLAYFYGVWDYIKNSGNYPEAENLALDWIGSLPGRRESRRFMGDHILTQKDMENYRHFPDAVAYGGWSFDEHCPGGIENLDEPASFFHARFNEPYEIPFRSLYSKNISNLLFAGRNVSVSHMALSSTRIICTCAMMGQAVGTAAAMCVQDGITPRVLGKKKIGKLQEQLLRDDSFIPNRPAADSMDLARSAKLKASSTISGNVDFLVDGVSRDEVDALHHWQSEDTDSVLELTWKKSIELSKVELKGDTNLQRKIMMHKNPAKNVGQVLDVPPELIKDLTIEAKVDGDWIEIAQVNENITRLVKTNFDPIQTKSIRINLKNTWGSKNVKLFEVRCYS